MSAATRPSRAAYKADRFARRHAAAAAARAMHDAARKAALAPDPANNPTQAERDRLVADLIATTKENDQ